LKLCHESIIAPKLKPSVQCLALCHCLNDEMIGLAAPTPKILLPCESLTAFFVSPHHVLTTLFVRPDPSEAIEWIFVLKSLAGCLKSILVIH